MKINQNTYLAIPLKTSFKASLLSTMMPKQAALGNTNPVNTNVLQNNPAYLPFSSNTVQDYNKVNVVNNYQGSLLTSLIKKTQVPTIVQTTSEPLVGYQNNLRSLFQNNQSVIYALVPRTFNAKDLNNDGLIEGNEESGYFTNMVERLDELKSYGVNTLHILPINPPGNLFKKGELGSVYAPLDYLSIDPKLDDPRNPKNVYEEAKEAFKECHRKGIKVMVDLPSCMSVDLYNARPDLAARDSEGKPKTPEGWEDIRMFNPWEDADKRILNKALVDYHKKFIDMCIDLGIDGIRADVGRAKPPEFWDIITTYARSKDPEFAFLAECYTYEDASPMKNMPADRPEEALDSGFDSYYGQYHIFHQWKAKDFHQFIKENIDMSYNHNKGKSLIGSFATHDDDSPMSHGGADYCMMTNVVQATVPMTNPYIISGFESGDRYLHKFGNKFVNKTFNELLQDNTYKVTIDDCLRTSLFKQRDALKKLMNGPDANKKVAILAEMDEYKDLFEELKSRVTIKDSIIYYAHPQRLDIFNNSAKPMGENPEIGKHFGTLMNELRPKYGELITKGSYIELPVKNNSRDEVIAYARHKDGKTLVVVVNHDVNAKQSVKVKVPGLLATEKLEDLAPKYGMGSSWTTSKDYIDIELGPAQAHVFEVNTPNIEQAFNSDKVLKQNL